MSPPERPKRHFFTPAVPLVRVRVEYHPSLQQKGENPFRVTEDLVVAILASFERTASQPEGRGPAGTSVDFMALFLRNGRMQGRTLPKPSHDDWTGDWTKSDEGGYWHDERVVHSAEVGQAIQEMMAGLLEVEEAEKCTLGGSVVETDLGVFFDDDDAAGDASDEGEKPSPPGESPEGDKK